MFPLLVLGGIAAYAMMNQKKAAQPDMPTSRPSRYQPAQPSQTYPFRPINPPRVDNANQPWYNGARQFMSGPAETQLQSAAKGLAATGTIVHSMSDIWGSMSDFFGGDDAKSNLVSTDSMPGDNIMDTADQMMDVSYDDGSSLTDNFSSDYSGDYQE